MRQWGGRNDLVFVCFCINPYESELEMTDKTGGPAFPYSWWDEQTGANAIAKGMTLRDYFAAKALVGHLANGGWKCEQSHFDDVAEGAYRLADAMLKAREQA